MDLGISDLAGLLQDVPEHEPPLPDPLLGLLFKRLSLVNVSPNEKAIEIVLNSGERVPAELVSEGLLFYLGFLALRHLSPRGVFLVEEPENGLHPSRIKDVVRILRKISETTQVLMATHSPLVINELSAEEVTVITRDKDAGTRANPMKETTNFEERSKIYALGELWLSYADGVDEAPLLSTDDPQ